MFSSRRPGKRSIIGTRVCAPNEDGFYHPGVIQAMAVAPSLSTEQARQPGEQGYVVLFDDGSTKTFRDRDLIGSGFQTFTAIHAKPGQTVYITHHGREVRGRIVKKEGRPTADDEDQLLVTFGQCPDEATVSVKLDEVRLIESRKSARLIEQEMDHVRLVDLPPASEGKKRNVIDVPTPCAKHSRGSYSRSLDHNDIYQNGTFRNSKDIETEIMDEHMAALVLTSLSCSPVSPVFSPQLLDFAGTSPGQSFCNGDEWRASSHASSPSPPQLILSQSAPAKVDPFFFSERFKTGELNGINPEISKRTVFQCTWRGCHKIYNTNPGIERHVRLEHLGPKDDDCMNDDEEDFYYTEVEVSLDTVTEIFEDMHTSSPSTQNMPNSNQFRLPPDHDYQRKEFRSTPLNIPKSRCVDDYQSSGFSLPSVPSLESRCPALSWQTNDQTPVSSLAKSFDYSELSPGLHVGPLSAKSSSSSSSSSASKKSRNDVKKCRKVYGLENRSSWCTQCKWKKACTRFLEKGDVT